MIDTILDIRGVNKRYKGQGARSDVEALKDINLTLKKGDFVALHGPSGCGKSTLLLVAGGLLRPDSGSVLINNEDLYTLNNSQRAQFRAKNIGFVFQQFYLIPYLNVIDNIMISDIATGREADSASRAEKILEQFGILHRKEHRPYELSVGEQQRVALARAVFAGASILFADEPTGNLDKENSEIVLKYLKKFSEGGGAVIMVTHDERAISFASQTISLSDGAIGK